jgi:hypothetical protein
VTPTTPTATPTAPTGGGGDGGGGGGGGGNSGGGGGTTTTNSGSGNSGLSAGAIVGIVIGGVVGVCLIIAIVVTVCCVGFVKADAPLTVGGPAETYSSVPTTVTTTTSAPAPFQTEDMTTDSYSAAPYSGAPFANPSVITYHTAGGTEVPAEGLGHVGNDDHVMVMPSAPVADVGGF